ncbi:hypothetical protein [Mucilaginibacter sp.]|uniref:hypothetical protein n=1 Tax=Mucilaginibacter sp. TaxID=1882438 RepID=UPI003D0FD5DA
MTEELAPIILFIYKRPDHTRRVLEALQKNMYASNSVLYVFADGAKNNASAEDLKVIEQTRAVIKEKKWCKEVTLIIRETNMNLEDNVIDGVTQIVQKHGKVVVLEDDIITSPYFLKYCNDGLKMYGDTKSVFSINAFMFPIDFETEPTTFLCPLATSSWGWATWADRWAKFETEPKYVDALEDNWMLRSRFNFGSTNHFSMLKYMNTWDLRWYYTAFINNGVGVFPTKSLTKNIGFDGSGTHGGNEDLEQDIYLSEFPLVYQSSINLNAYSKLLYYFKIVPLSIKQRIKNRIKKLINY